MTTAVQRRRGTNTEHASFTGLEGEISVNTTNESVHVHDGSTAGGFELMRADGANSTVTLGDISGVTAGTGLSGGGTTGTVTLDIDGTVATLAGTQTFTNKTLTSPILNTPTIGTSFTIGGATITETELEILDGATVTTTELNYVDGVTSSIQTQIDAKAPLASPSFTGNVSVGGTVDGRDVAADGTKLDLINQGVATTDSPAFAGLTVDTDTLAVDSTNNRVGIGTASPSSELHIASASPVLTLQDTDSTEPLSTYVSFKDSGGNEHGWMGYGSSSADSLQIANTHDDIILYTGSSGTAAERMRIDSSGNVGIGTSSPTFKLDVAGNARANYFALRGNESAPSESAFVYRPATGVLGFGTGTAERMRIDSSGKVGIGTTSPNKKLVVNENGSECVAIIKSSDTGTAGLYLGGQTDEIKGGIVFNNSDNSLQLRGYNNAERMRIDASGNLLLGTTVSPNSGDPTSVRYGIGVQAGSLSSTTTCTAGVITNVLDMANAVSGNNGAGLWLINVVRGGASYATHFTGVFGVNSSSMALYQTIRSGGMTVSVNGLNLRLNVSTTDGYRVNAIPLSINT